ncbi:MAG: hypothetical protein B7Y95_13545 [Rhizobiales bacterium 32-66-11]|nr:MAG: hypothetical protein B7Y95_13545 [Rhizobiales bacterium 32-66-11]
MKLWSARQLVALFLAVFVTAGTSLSAVQASDMTVKMAMASDVGGSGHDPCQGCPAGDDGMKAISCAAICVAPVLAVLPEAEPVMLVHKTVSFITRYPLLHGKTSPPEPYPPRSIDIG